MKKSMPSQTSNSSAKPEQHRGKDLNKDMHESQKKGEQFRKQHQGSDARKPSIGD